MRLLAAAALLGLGSQGAAAQYLEGAKPTLEDCKLALQSLSTPPMSTSLPFLAAATGGCVGVWDGALWVVGGSDARPPKKDPSIHPSVYTHKIYIQPTTLPP